MAISFEEYARCDATDLARRVREGAMSAGEVLEAAIAAAEALNPTINAIVQKMYDLARAQAARLTPAMPFAGVPFLLKDSGAYYQGVPCT